MAPASPCGSRPRPIGSRPEPEPRDGRPMDEVEIPGDATYSPVALTDLLIAAPLASRLLLGASLPGRVLQAAALGAYAGSSVKDWIARRDVRRIDFEREYGADVFRMEPMPVDERVREI